MFLVVLIITLFAVLVGFLLGAVLGWTLANNEQLRTDNTRWNLINQTTYSLPD